MNFESAAVDSALDALSLAGPGTPREDASDAVQTAILAERPISNLVTPFWHVSLSDRFADYEPYGSDYYVIRADYAGPQVGGFYLDPDNRPEVVEVEVPVVETVTETVVEEDDPTVWIVIIVVVAVVGLVIACVVYMKGKKKVEHLQALLDEAKTNKP